MPGVSRMGHLIFFCYPLLKLRGMKLRLAIIVILLLDSFVETVCVRILYAIMNVGINRSWYLVLGITKLEVEKHLTHLDHGGNSLHIAS